MVAAGQTGGADTAAGLCDVVFNNDCTPLNQTIAELPDRGIALLINNLDPQVQVDISIPNRTNVENFNHIIEVTLTLVSY